LSKARMPCRKRMIRMQVLASQLTVMRVFLVPPVLLLV
jgi:hypothetical protein